MCWRVFAGVAGTSNIGNLAQVRVVNGGAIRAEGSRGERRNDDDLFLSSTETWSTRAVQAQKQMAGVDKVQIHVLSVHVDKVYKKIHVDVDKVHVYVHKQEREKKETKIVTTVHYQRTPDSESFPSGALHFLFETIVVRAFTANETNNDR